MSSQKRVFKTTKKVSGGRKTFRPWKEWEEGEFVVGKFVGMHTDQYDKECPIITVEYAEFTDMKAAKALHGKDIVLNNAGQLNKGVEKLAEGDFIKVTYQGTSEIEKGKYAGKDAHLIDVEIVEEDNGDDEEEVEEDDSTDDL